MSGIVIIGAGQAGSSLAIKLRTLGYEGAVTLIGEEPYAPYQRPPLSKTYLLGEMALERLYLRPQELYRDHNIELRLAAQVTASAVDVASLGESLGFAVHAFSQTNEQLMAQLQRIEQALDKSMTRSDEQLAYYVAQAREIVDLSIGSQKDVLEALQRRTDLATQGAV